jgi:phage-related minor tail protein
METFRRAATDVSGAINQAFSNAFSSMEDAFVNFVKTGKLDFKSLADSIISDLARIAFRQMLSGLFGGTTGGFNFMSLFGGTRASGGSVSSSAPYIVGENGPEIFMPNRSGSIVPNSGLGGMGGGNVNVNVINNSNSQATTRETVDGRGNRNIDVIIGDVVAKEIGRIGSSVNQSIRQTFNSAPALVGR